MVKIERKGDIPPLLKDEKIKLRYPSVANTYEGDCIIHNQIELFRYMEREFKEIHQKLDKIFEKF